MRLLVLTRHPLYLWHFVAPPLTVHPRLRLDLQEPILDCGNAAQIFPDMLFAHIPDGDLFPVAVNDAYPEQFLRQENALGMMPQGPVTKVGKERLRFVEPVVNREVVLSFSAELSGAALCVLSVGGPCRYTS